MSTPNSPQTVDIIKVPREYISRPLFFTVLARDINLFNSVTIDGRLVSIDDGAVTEDPYSLLVM